jgi:hypothetical protein
MVKEVSAVHPEAKFASPGITSGGIGRWLGPFLDYTVTNALPLHAITFHDFGRDYTLGSRWIIPNVKACLAELDRRPYFRDRNVEIHVGECSYFEDPKDGGAADRASAAAQLPQTIRELLAEPRLTLVQWAQLFDTGHPGMWGNLGIIDAETRKAKPLYNVLVMYALMPVRSARCEEQGPVQCLASQDKDTVAVMLYNRTGEDAPCRLEVRNLPFAAGTKLHVCTLAVDTRHSSFWDTPGDGRLEVVARRTASASAEPGAAGAAVVIDETVPAPGVRLVLLSRQAPRFDPAVIAEVIRRDLAYAPAPADNPLKGLVPYAGERGDAFPHSMEFEYLPLSALLTGPDRYDWQPLDALLDAVAGRCASRTRRRTGTPPAG